MDYYDVNGNKIDERDIAIDEEIFCSQKFSDADTISEFYKVKDFFDILVKKEVKLSTKEKSDLNEKIMSFDSYEEQIRYWLSSGYSPFTTYLLPVLESTNNKWLNAHINIFPRSTKELNYYVRKSAEWINKQLADNCSIHKVYTFENYQNNYFRIYRESSYTQQEIDRVQLYINETVTNFGLNSKLKEFPIYFSDSTLDISFFKIDHASRIENIWSLMIGMGLIYGSAQYLDFLEKKLDENKGIIRYELKENTSFHSRFTDDQLLEIYKNLSDEQYIINTTEQDFLNIFREKKLLGIKPIVWKRRNGHWLQMLYLLEIVVCPNYNNIELYKYIFKHCFDLEGSKSFSEDVRRSSKLRIDRIKNGEIVPKIFDIVNLKKK